MAKTSQQAQRTLEQAVWANAPNDVPALNALAAADLKLGDGAGAETRLRKAIELAPHELEAAVALAKVLRTQGNLPAEEQTLKQLVARNPSSASVHSALAEFYFAENMAALADQEYRQALRVNSHDIPSLIGLAGLQLRAGKMDEAEALYRQVSVLPDAPRR